MKGGEKMKLNKKGFTLIELLVVIAIIGLLSTLAVVALNTARTKSRDAKRISDVKQIQTALELYYADKGNYPTLVAPGAALGAGNYTVLCSTGWSGAACGGGATTYMGQVPKDPGSTSYTYVSADGTTYSIAFTLESGTGSLAAGAHTATPNGIQ